MLYPRRSSLYWLLDFLSTITKIYFLVNSQILEIVPQWSMIICYFRVLNIDILNKKKDNGNYFSGLCDSSSLKNFVTNITFVKFINSSSIHVLIIKVEVSITLPQNDIHILQSYFKKLPLKNIKYWNSSMNLIWT